MFKAQHTVAGLQWGSNYKCKFNFVQIMNNSEIDLAINAEDSNPHAVQYHCLAPLIASKSMAVVLIAVTVQTRLITAVWHNRLVCCFCYDHLQGSCQWAQSLKVTKLQCFLLQTAAASSSLNKHCCKSHGIHKGCRLAQSIQQSKIA